MKADTRQRMLDVVLARLGWKQTAERLQIDARTLDAWVSGAARIPDEKLRELVDIIDQTNEG